ncbi:EutN/CcmL family microcompartment protein [Virgibacillus necropolis]|uniref:Ethanolamine utilization protein EutN n=1 Tax=Virgibacillus necropolis TaxID=163877 RepID=A0A221M9M5_9BACI|nr:EutN/CcmL family microcompartment protein [Virgibacillus necropolis]ASN04347.1 ethanolamine utilization protein EutN [Virgibacillus necropolis]
MIVGEVVGNIWATRKEEGLTGLKFLVVQPDSSFSSFSPSTFVAVDRIGAGVGDKVMVTNGSSASRIDNVQLPIDSLIIGIVDSVEVERGEGNG